MQLNIHLNFDGQCEEAFRFYEKTLGTKVDFSMTWDQVPGHADQRMTGKIMHTSMKVGNTILMGADSPSAHAQKPQGFAVSLDIQDPAEADRLFNALSAGGSVTMPIAETFWAKRFGMFTDKFGQPWMINCSKPMN